ncbi:MAG: bifunctional YncE family protein/alkaline phosphatase family protein [Pseudomonadota bacterium]|nr:bifunctional YncE family protein/alkaline phosphatase family protein [Pseudomonadota bacterium]
MHKILVRLLPAAVAAALAAAAVGPAAAADLLGTGQTVTPTAAPGATVTDLNPGLTPVPGVNMLPNQDVTKFLAGQPETTLLSPDGKTLLVLTSGYNGLADVDGNVVPAYSTEYVFVYDVTRATPALAQVLQVPFTYDGLSFAPDGKRFYVSGGHDNVVHSFNLGSDGKWSEPATPISIGAASVYPSQADPQVAGIAVNADGSRLVAANYESDAISIVDTATGTLLSTFDLRPGKIDPAQAGVPGGEFPFWVAVKGKSTAYVSSLRDREIVVVDFSAAPRVLARVAVKGNPNRMLLNRAQSLLFVASDNSDTVDVINTRTNRVVTSIATAGPEDLFHGRAPVGSSPNGLALSPDEKTLYVTNGGSNSLAVIALDDEGHGEVQGLIPTGWYPNSVTVSQDGRTLYVADGKRLEGPNPGNCRSNDGHIPAQYTPSGCLLPTDYNGAQNQYILQLSKGDLLTIPVPDQEQLEGLTRQVARNNGFNLQLSGHAQSVMAQMKDKIRHVIYIIKENRTYDQVLGDLPVGNGDASITQFPQPLTPNLHALATEFVDLDNFHVAGDVSMDGWQWSTAARTSDANEKAYIINYAGRGLSYDSEGDARGSITVWLPTAAQRQQTDPSVPNDPDLLPGPRNEVEVDGPAGQLGAGYLWDAALRAGKSVRDFGVFADEIAGQFHTLMATPAGQDVLRDPRKSGTTVAIPTVAALAGNIDPYYRSWQTCMPDFWREHEWAQDFDSWVEASDKSGQDKLPNFEIMRFPQDHTGCGGHGLDHVDTPELQGADNDYAVGLLVEKVAHSRFADSTLIVIVEDDAQDGPDHVDARRSPAFLIGPYVKHNAVVSEQYTTVNAIRTIEDLLGLEHLNLHDGGASPMVEALDPKQRAWSFTAVPSPILRAETTLPLPSAAAAELALPKVRSRHSGQWWAKAFEGLDFAHEDANDAGRLNRILWQGMMGEERAYPGAMAPAEDDDAVNDKAPTPKVSLK